MYAPGHVFNPESHTDPDVWTDADEGGFDEAKDMKYIYDD
jgi:hypothetical protein